MLRKAGLLSAACLWQRGRRLQQRRPQADVHAQHGGGCPAAVVSGGQCGGLQVHAALQGPQLVQGGHAQPQAPQKVAAPAARIIEVRELAALCCGGV